MTSTPKIRRGDDDMMAGMTYEVKSPMNVPH